MPDRKPFGKYLSALPMVVLWGIVSGCSHLALLNRQPPTPQHLDGRVLVLPPISVVAEHAQFCEQLGNALTNSVGQYTHDEVVDGTSVKELAPYLKWANLAVDGSVNRQEAITIAQTLDCRTVLILQLSDLNNLPPQRLSARIWWLDAATATVRKTQIVRVDLRDQKTRSKYQRYLRSGRLPLPGRAPHRQTDMQTALLSPHMFGRYAADELAAAIFEPVAEPKSKRHVQRLRKQE